MTPRMIIWKEIVVLLVVSFISELKYKPFYGRIVLSLHETVPLYDKKNFDGIKKIILN